MIMIMTSNNSLIQDYVYVFKKSVECHVLLQTTAVPAIALK